MQTTRRKTILWIFAVYVFSFICYVPTLLKQLGVIVPVALLNLKYCFVFIPVLISIIFLVREHDLKDYLICNFKPFSLKEIIICIIIALIGIAVTFCFSIAANMNLFGSVYFSVLSLVISCVYLFATALIEEMAWRGFLFKRIVVGDKMVKPALFVGIVWAGWHIPMWSIRNSLPVKDIISLFIWAVIISIVLGMLYCLYKNILSVALMHMIFNVCFLAPPKYNIVVICLCIIICYAFKKHNIKNSN